MTNRDIYDTPASAPPPVTAAEAKTTDSEKLCARRLFDAYFSGKSIPVFNMRYNGKTLREDIKAWANSAVRRCTEKTEKITQTCQNDEAGLRVTVCAELFADECTFMFFAEAENISSENSPILSEFYILDTDITVGDSAKMYYLSGSDTDPNDFNPDDFMLYERSASDGHKLFCADGGRSTLQYMPYFNICGDIGAVLGIGWTGQWAADFNAADGRLHVKVSQKGLEAYLRPGEKIRTPLVSITLYGGKCTKGFNMFRSFIKNDVMPDDFGPKRYYCVSGGSYPLKNSAEEVRTIIEKLKENGLNKLIDGFWFDAEHWFFDNTAKGVRWDNSVGNWTPDEKKYPDGFSAVSDMLHGEGCRVMLWYEPERMSEGSFVYKKAEKNGWLLEKPNDTYEARFFLNMAEDEACEFITKTVLTSLRENKIDVYRQDFNCIRTPSALWEQCDGENRRGITENRYVTNLYKYIDALLDGIPGLVMDNCASGGQRLDLEMMRRSFPLWRSDYNCFNRPDLSEATQSHSAGISLFLPISNASNAWEKDIYENLSHLTPVTEVYYDFAVERPDECRRYLEIHEAVSESFLKDYYLPIPADPSDKTWTVTQFGDESDGTLMCYRPSAAPQSVSVRFSGLDTESKYGIRAIYAPDGTRTEQRGKMFLTENGTSSVFDGKTLFKDGIEITLPPRSALILSYKKEKSR